MLEADSVIGGQEGEAVRELADGLMVGGWLVTREQG